MYASMGPAKDVLMLAFNNVDLSGSCVDGKLAIEQPY